MEFDKDLHIEAVPFLALYPSMMPVLKHSNQ